MGILSLIWQDLRSLNARLPPAVKIVGLICLVALIFGGWYVGANWWTEPVMVKREICPRGGVIGVSFGLVFLCYIAWVKIDIERRAKAHPLTDQPQNANKIR